MMNNVDIPILYHSKTSVCFQKVRLVLAELDVEWQGFVVDLKKGEQFADEYLSVNPKASVPTYIENGTTLTESNDIMLHLSKNALGGKHPFADPDRLNEVMFWLDLSVRFHTAVHVLTTLALNRAKLQNLSDQELREKLSRIPDKARAQRIFDVVQNGLAGIAASSSIIYLKNIFQKIETDLEQNAFLCGGELSLADFAILPFVKRIEFLQLTPDWSGATFSNVQDWMQKLEARPSFERAVLSFHSAEALEKYKVHGTPLREELMKL